MLFSVLETIERVASIDMRKIDSVKKQAWNYILRMKASLSRTICRFCGYFLFKVFRRVMRRLLVCPEQLMAVREAELVCSFDICQYNEVILERNSDCLLATPQKPSGLFVSLFNL